MSTPDTPDTGESASQESFDDVAPQVQRIIDAARSADELAQSVIERLEALHARAAVVQAPALEALMEQLGTTCTDLSESLQRETERAEEATQQWQSAAEQARSEAQSAAEALAARLEQQAQQVADEVRSTAAFLVDEVQARFERHEAALQSGLDAAMAKAQATWSRAQDDLGRGVEELLRRTGQSLSGAQAEAVKASQERLQRALQLKTDLDGCARTIAEIIGTFSGLMGSTRTGLNVTAGTLTDVVSVFQEVS